MMGFLKIWAIVLHLAVVGAVIFVIWLVVTLDWNQAGNDIGSFAGSIVRGFNEQAEP